MATLITQSNGPLYSNMVIGIHWSSFYNKPLLKSSWQTATCYNENTKQAATQDSTALYNRTQSFGTQAFKSTKQNTSLARSV